MTQYQVLEEQIFFDNFGLFSLKILPMTSGVKWFTHCSRDTFLSSMLKKSDWHPLKPLSTNNQQGIANCRILVIFAHLCIAMEDPSTPHYDYYSWGVLKLLTSIPRVFCHFSEFFIHTFSYSCNKIQCCRVIARS